MTDNDPGGGGNGGGGGGGTTPRGSPRGSKDIDPLDKIVGSTFAAHAEPSVLKEFQRNTRILSSKIGQLQRARARVESETKNLATLRAGKCPDDMAKFSVKFETKFEDRTYKAESQDYEIAQLPHGVTMALAIPPGLSSRKIRESMFYANAVLNTSLNIYNTQQLIQQLTSETSFRSISFSCTDAYRTVPKSVADLGLNTDGLRHS